MVCRVADAVGVPPRAFQNGFVREYGTSPLGCLHRVRLERVRSDLRPADPTTGTTVRAVAAHWAFPNPSRFPATYVDTYGQRPDKTLRS